jgi:DNA-binding transcriptional MerR regulator
MCNMRIGQLADAAGVTADTIRFYERRGVLPSPQRQASGYRMYSQRTVEQLRLAKTLQAHGLTLDEIIDAMAALDAGTACADERWRLEQVLDRIDRKLAELQELRSTVVGTLASCGAGSCELNQTARSCTESAC